MLLEKPALINQEKRAESHIITMVNKITFLVRKENHSNQRKKKLNL
jgi:hypothetical protein